MYKKCEQDCLKKLYKGIDNGYTINSKQEKQMTKTGNPPTYGEVEYQGLVQMLQGLKTNGKIFCDLGSGIGKIVIQAAYNYGFKKSIGVELSVDRHNRAVQAYKKIRDIGVRNKIRFYNMNLLNIDLTKMDIIYISNLCFPAKLLTDVGIKFDRELKPGCIVVSSKRFPTRKGKVVKEFMIKMSWSNRSPVVMYKF